MAIVASLGTTNWTCRAVIFSSATLLAREATTAAPRGARRYALLLPGTALHVDAAMNTFTFFFPFPHITAR